MGFLTTTLGPPANLAPPVWGVFPLVKLGQSWASIPPPWLCSSLAIPTSACTPTHWRLFGLLHTSSQPHHSLGGLASVVLTLLSWVNAWMLPLWEVSACLSNRITANPAGMGGAMDVLCVQRQCKAACTLLHHHLPCSSPELACLPGIAVPGITPS